LSCSSWTQRMGGAREDLGEILSISFLLPLCRQTPPTGVQHHHYTTTRPQPAERPRPYLTLLTFALAGMTRGHNRCPEASRRSQRPALRHQTPLATVELDQSSPAAQQPHRPRHDPALQAPDAAQDATTGMRVPACTRTHSRRLAHGRARHRAPITTGSSPSTLASPARRATHRNAHTQSETDAAVKQALHACLSRPYPWT
jgi:hypothetical protein